MGLSRGDFQKQFIWLEEHFTTRHAGKAQPYMCLIEGCSLRFTLKRSLEEHLRTGHEKAKAKRSHTEEGELSRVKSCYQWTPLPYYIPKKRFLDHATEEWIVMRLRQYERTTGASFIPREPATPRGGAAYRKRRRILTFAIEPLKIAPKVISDTMGLADAKSLIKSAFINAENSLDRTNENEKEQGCFYRKHSIVAPVTSVKLFQASEIFCGIHVLVSQVHIHVDGFYVTLTITIGCSCIPKTLVYQEALLSFTTNCRYVIINSHFLNCFYSPFHLCDTLKKAYQWNDSPTEKHVLSKCLKGTSLVSVFQLGGSDYFNLLSAGIPQEILIILLQYLLPITIEIDWRPANTLKLYIS
ncbi:hypothetical protein DINM_004925 [Dirofilaria immitis]|nr:hypothetical protein [Dirofilaria immitis]